MKNHILQAYKQAPWRIQIQWIGLFLLALVLVASITGVYLSISAQAAASGRKIQSLERQINNINNEIAELTAELATVRSIENMQSKAEALGFAPLNPREAVYLEIPGYNPHADLALAPPRVSIIAESPSVRAAYKISLWDWLVQNIWQAPLRESQLEGEVLP
jgi:hypothetical protein